MLGDGRIDTFGLVIRTGDEENVKVELTFTMIVPVAVGLLHGPLVFTV